MDAIQSQLAHITERQAKDGADLREVAIAIKSLRDELQRNTFATQELNQSILGGPGVIGLAEQTRANSRDIEGIKKRLDDAGTKRWGFIMLAASGWFAALFKSAFDYLREKHP